jgi:FkbM family methyltransferase
MPDSIKFRCPPTMINHVRKVCNGEYDIAYEHSHPVILDIGANIGSFAIWAMQRWPGCVVHCYEPLPENYAMLRENVASFGDRVHLNNFAIGDVSHDKLFLGLNNCREASFFDPTGERSAWVKVETRPPAVLPEAQVLKMDTEGAEAEILAGIALIDYDAIVLEYHSESNRRKVDQLLGDYILVGGEIEGENVGVLKYLHKRLRK